MRKIPDREIGMLKSDRRIWSAMQKKRIAVRNWRKITCALSLSKVKFSVKSLQKSAQVICRQFLITAGYLALSIALCLLAGCGELPGVSTSGENDALPAYAEGQPESDQSSGAANQGLQEGSQSDLRPGQQDGSQAGGRDDGQDDGAQEGVRDDGQDDGSQEASRDPGSEEPASPSGESGTPEQQSAEVSITISAAGDVTLGNFVGQGYAGSFRQTWEKVQDAAYFLENVREIFESDDMTLVNLEGPLTTAEKGEEKTYCISGDPEYVEALTLGSVEAVSMGNNHSLDYFEQGLQDTVEAVEGAGIAYAYNDVTGIYETQGIRIGFVSVNEVYDGEEVETYLEEGIRGLQEEKADLILVCCHWGKQLDNYPNDYQQSLGKKCIDWGADMVIGHHPHVIQGIEEYNGKYIVYSLGNFCFGANRNPRDKDCIIFQQTFTFVDGEKQEESQARIIPCSISSVSDKNDYKPTPSEGDEARRIIDRVNKYSKKFGVSFDGEGYVSEEE